MTRTFNDSIRSVLVGAYLLILGGQALANTAGHMAKARRRQLKTMAELLRKIEDIAIQNNNIDPTATLILEEIRAVKSQRPELPF